jgi:hypothetical protein
MSPGQLLPNYSKRSSIPRAQNLNFRSSRRWAIRSLSRPKADKQLLEPVNPFESIRLATFPILRQNLHSKQTILNSTTFDTLAPIVFTLPAEEPVLGLSLEEVVSTMYPSWFTECANLLWIIHDIDVKNKSGIRNQETLARIKGEWLDPLRRRAGEWSQQAESEAGEARVGFVIQRLMDALERASQAIGR